MDLPPLPQGEKTGDKEIEDGDDGSNKDVVEAQEMDIHEGDSLSAEKDHRGKEGDDEEGDKGKKKADDDLEDSDFPSFDIRVADIHGLLGKSPAIVEKQRKEKVDDENGEEIGKKKGIASHQKEGILGQKKGIFLISIRNVSR